MDDLLEERLERDNIVEEHPFFHYYGQLIHQQNMMADNVRTGTYRNAIINNKHDFKDKVVLDVGTGSGLLAFFAIQAGAKKVYAAEASAVAESAMKLVEANGLSDRIIVIKGKVEEIELPEKVDIIISEPMGFMLVHERMLESYVAARDRFLKPRGLMLPSTGSIFICPFTDQALYDEQISKVNFWNQHSFYGIDLRCLAQKALSDHFAQPVVGYFDPSILLSSDICSHYIDFHTVSMEEMQTIEIPFHFVINRTAIMHGIGSWFDVDFNGSTAKVKLSTSPSSQATHWYQCRLLLPSPIAVNASQSVSGVLKMVANPHKSFTISMSISLDGTSISATTVVSLQDQMYHYLTSASSQVAADGSSHGYASNEAWS